MSILGTDPFILFIASGQFEARAGLPSDAEIHDKIVGLWGATTGSTSNSITLRADGTYASKVLNWSNRGEITDFFQGRWRIGNGYLMMTLTKATRPEVFPVNHTDRYKLIDVTDDTVTFKDEEREEMVTWKRKDK